MTTIQPELTPRGVPRRAFLALSSLAAAAAALPTSLLVNLRSAKAQTLPDSVILDAFNGLLAFVVPGQDPYSAQQGLPSDTPGGVEANAVFPLIPALNQAGLPPPGFASLAELIAFLLDTVSGYVDPAPNGPFESNFANLAYAEKAMVFAIMESGAAGPGIAPLVNPLLFFAGFMAYSDTPVIDPSTGTPVSTPIGWTLSNHEGVFDGRADFLGYYLGYTEALP